jgi:hypothetical protein
MPRYYNVTRFVNGRGAAISGSNLPWVHHRRKPVFA